MQRGNRRARQTVHGQWHGKFGGQSNELSVTSLVEALGAPLVILTGTGWSLAGGAGGGCGPLLEGLTPSSELTLP